MNGTMYGHDPSLGFYTGNGPMHPSYEPYYPSTFTPNAHPYPYGHQDYLPSPPTNDVQQPFYADGYPQQPSTHPNVYNFETLTPATIAYYDNIHARVRSNAPVSQHPSSISTNSSLQYPFTNSPGLNSAEQATSAPTNGHADPTFLVVSGNQPNLSPSPQVTNERTNE